MQFISSWATQDQKILLNMSDEVIQVFQQNIQENSDSKEGGGILLGYVRGQHLEIVEATVPTVQDQRFRFFFERMPFSHSSIAEKRWRESGGLIRYLGEWHTHPEDYPSPSQVDRVEWRKLAEKRKDRRPVLAVIVGRQGMHIELVSVNDAPVLMRPLSDCEAEDWGLL